MVKSKFIAVAASAALAAMLCLSACGGQAASSSASATTSDSAAASSTEVSNEAASSVSASAEDILISWQGTLEDGTLVDYIASDDGMNGGLVLTKSDSSEPLQWLGAMTTNADGTSTITDDTTKETITFTLGEAAEDNTMQIDVEGYGMGTLAPMSAADWQRYAESQEITETLGGE